MAISGLKVGTTPPEDERLMYFNTDNNTLNFFNPDTREWDRCRGVYADENPEEPEKPEEPGKIIPYPITDTTKLLLHFEDDTDSSNYHNKLTFSRQAVSTWHPSNYAKFGKGDADGNTYDYAAIMIPPENIVFGSNDFTIDWWEQADSTKRRFVFSSKYATDASQVGGIVIGYGDGLVYASSGTGSWNLINGVKMMDSNSDWTHWAFVRHGNTLTSYKNGTQYAQTPINGAIGQYTDKMALFGYLHRSTDQSTWSNSITIDEFRIVIGEAVWTSDFTPPDHPYNTPAGETGAIGERKPNKKLPNIIKPITGAVRLLLHGDSFKDDSFWDVPITNVGVTISDKSRYPSGKSFYFNGSARIEIPSSAIKFDRTTYIEWWEYVESATPGTIFSSNYSSPSGQIGGMLIGYSNRYVYWGTAASTWDLCTGKQYGDGAIGNWRHYRMEFEPNIALSYPDIRLYYDNGRTQIIDCENVDNYKATFCPDDAVMAIGNYHSTQNAPFVGYIQDFMITQAGIPDRDIDGIVDISDEGITSEIPFNTSFPENFGYLFDAQNAQPGFIGQDGTIRTPGDVTEEVYSDYFPVPAYSLLQMECSGTVDNNYLWMCVEFSDSTYQMISRPAFQLEAGTGKQEMTRAVKIPSGTSFVRFSYRKFNDAKLMVTNAVQAQIPFDNELFSDNWGYINFDGSVTYERDERSSVVSDLCVLNLGSIEYIILDFRDNFHYLSSSSYTLDVPNRNFDYASMTIAFYNQDMQLLGTPKTIQATINMDDPSAPELGYIHEQINKEDIPAETVYWRVSYTSWGIATNTLNPDAKNNLVNAYIHIS